MMFKIFIYHFISNIPCTPYPTAQKCLPQYRCFSFGNSFCNILELLPFNLFTIPLIFVFGGYSICMCTWSELTTPFRILTSSESQIWISNSRQRNCRSPYNTLERYFVNQTMWHVNRETVWDPFRWKTSIKLSYRFFRNTKVLHLKCRVLNPKLRPIKFGFPINLLVMIL